MNSPETCFSPQTSLSLQHGGLICLIQNEKILKEKILKDLRRRYKGDKNPLPLEYLLSTTENQNFDHDDTRRFQHIRGADLKIILLISE